MTAVDLDGDSRDLPREEQAVLTIACHHGDDRPPPKRYGYLALPACGLADIPEPFGILVGTKSVEVRRRDSRVGHPRMMEHLGPHGVAE